MLIVDFKPIFMRYSENPRLYDIYRHIPLQIIVSCVIEAHSDETEVDIELSASYALSRSRTKIHVVDREQLEWLLLHLIEDVRRVLYVRSSRGVDFILDRWVDNTTAVLKPGNWSIL